MKEHKTEKVIGIIAGIIVAAILIQWGRYSSKLKPLANGQGVVLPVDYFPFNGTFTKNATTGKVTKS